MTCSGHNEMRLGGGSNPGPLGLESYTLPLCQSAFIAMTLLNLKHNKTKTKKNQNIAYSYRLVH